MDVLSEVLRVVKLRGALFFNAELSAPWCLNEPSSRQIAPSLRIGSGHIILYHFVLEGRAFARTADGRQEDLSAGDVVVIPHGDIHVLGNGWPEKPVDAIKAFAGNLKEGLKLVRFGGGGEVTKLVCGYMVCDPRLSEIFLACLPTMIKVRVTDELSGQWLKNSIRFSVGEDCVMDAGSDLVIAKLSEVLFVETLRRYINGLPEEDIGWLAGARDPVIGRALAFLHAEPDHNWTIASLARRVGMSRTRLAERFQHFLGDSPMAYLAKWRLKLGAEMLESSSESIAEIAAAVGYGSEATFNRAFKREYELPPAQYRRRHRTLTV
jgi:AraC-like DNA-binding protein